MVYERFFHFADISHPVLRRVLHEQDPQPFLENNDGNFVRVCEHVLADQSASIEDLFKVWKAYMLIHHKTGLLPKENDFFARMLKDPRTDSYTKLYVVFECATSFGHVQVTKLLLEDERVDVEWHADKILKNACYNGNADIVRMLLDCPKFPVDNRVLYEAASKDRFAVVDVLLNHPRYDKTKVLDWVWLIGKDGGLSPRMAQRLMCDPLFDPNSATQRENFILTLPPAARIFINHPKFALFEAPDIV